MAFEITAQEAELIKARRNKKSALPGEWKWNGMYGYKRYVSPYSLEVIDRADGVQASVYNGSEFGEPLATQTFETIREGQDFCDNYVLQHTSSHSKQAKTWRDVFEENGATEEEIAAFANSKAIDIDSEVSAKDTTSSSKSSSAFKLTKQEAKMIVARRKRASLNWREGKDEFGDVFWEVADPNGGAWPWLRVEEFLENGDFEDSFRWVAYEGGIAKDSGEESTPDAAMAAAERAVGA